MEKTYSEYNSFRKNLLEEIKKNTDISCDKVKVPDFDAASLDILDDVYGLLRESWFISPINIPCPKGEDGLLDKLKYLLKKLIKKLIMFYVDPIIDEQNKFNANNVEMLYLVKIYMDTSTQKIKALEKEVEFLKKANAIRND